PLARTQLGKLHIYAGGEHPHAAQKPTSIDFKSKNRKNAKAA
ncbi:MAG TPA: 50S ribosomal protein L13, partial [Terricaulis sp.]|nr:50S ribosomal protein L13 [Terricaulis sp.]